MKSLILIFLLVIISGYNSPVIRASQVQNAGGVDSARIYNNMGVKKVNIGDFEAAGILFQRSLKLKIIDQGPSTVDLASTYLNLGVVSRRLLNNDDAMHYYDTAGYILLEHHGSDYLNLGVVYHNQGNILREKRDITSALSYYNNAKQIFLKNEMTGWLGTLYNNIGIAYELKGNYDQAKEYYYRSIDIRKVTDPAAVAITAGNLAICYIETGDLTSADKYYQLAIDVISENNGTNNVNYATNLQNYALFLITTANEYDRGHEQLLRALEIYRYHYGEKGHHVSRALMNIGYSFELTMNFDAALRYYHESLLANSKSFTSTDFSDNPSPGDRVFSPDHMLNSLKHKAFTLYLMSRENDQRSNLEASLSAFKAAMEFIEDIRMGHQSEDSRILLTKNEHETYLQAIHVAWKLYEITNEPAFIEEAFIFSEKSKAASLLSSIRDVEAKSFGGVPEELMAEERGLKKKIAAFREMIYEEQRSFDPDNARINFWQERIFTLELELRHLISHLENEYPNYYSLKYKKNFSDIANIMNHISSKDALVSYVHNDSLIYIFTITKDNFNFYCKRPEGFLESELEVFMGILTHGNIDRRVQDDFNDFKRSSRYFYNLLIEPLVPEIKDKRLIIIPDGLLTYIPFELLLSSDTNSGNNNYKNLPYLLRGYAISYSYSATLWQESNRRASVASNKTLSMAPGYNYSEAPLPETIVNRQYYRERLTPLAGAREEAVRVAELMDGKLLLDENATEYNFKNLAGDYHILHLAMHTLIDDENPMFSKLVFSETDCEIEDGFLNTYEIYNLGLNASLAVLSSCRSGYGVLHRGEGVMSLARGFLYAGVPSIIMTGWEIEDKSGAEIMISFYSYLLKGYRKDEALRQARLDFLDGADMLRAHPYFWGAYVCIGNPGEIFRSYRNFYPLLTFFGLLLVMVIILWREKLRRS